MHIHEPTLAREFIPSLDSTSHVNDNFNLDVADLKRYKLECERTREADDCLRYRKQQIYLENQQRLYQGVKDNQNEYLNQGYSQQGREY